MSENKLVEVALANAEKPIKMPIEEVKKWDIKTKTTIGHNVYVKIVEGEVYGLSMKDYNEIFQS
jgi:hypothetical protein